ncbi:MAG: class I SAM-dependent methyltransferase [bacterium]
MTKEWNEAYEGARPPWDCGVPSRDLTEVVETGRVRPCRALEFGCGTGTNAIYLAAQGFDVTGVDIATHALKQAEEKAKKARVRVRFIHASVTKLPSLGRPFDFVFDRGCFHTLENEDRPRYLKGLKRYTSPGTLFLLLCGSAKGRWPDTEGPPKVRKCEIVQCFTRDFDIVRISDTHFEDATGGPTGPIAYVVWLVRI